MNQAGRMGQGSISQERGIKVRKGVAQEVFFKYLFHFLLSFFIFHVFY
jgi:hypothetical protein